MVRPIDRGACQLVSKLGLPGRTRSCGRRRRVVILPATIILARYFKLKVAKWFAIHRAAATVAIVATLVGVILILQGRWAARGMHGRFGDRTPADAA